MLDTTQSYQARTFELSVQLVNGKYTDNIAMLVTRILSTTEIWNLETAESGLDEPILDY